MVFKILMMVYDLRNRRFWGRLSVVVACWLDWFFMGEVTCLCWFGRGFGGWIFA